MFFVLTVSTAFQVPCQLSSRVDRHTGRLHAVPVQEPRAVRVQEPVQEVLVEQEPLVPRKGWLKRSKRWIVPAVIGLASWVIACRILPNHLFLLVRFFLLD